MSSACPASLSNRITNRIPRGAVSLSNVPICVPREAEQTAHALAPHTRACLYAALASNDDEADMAALVRSASRPGFKDRIQQYLAG